MYKPGGAISTGPREATPLCPRRRRLGRARQSTLRLLRRADTQLPSEPNQPHDSETDTHMFHREHILVPATRLAAGYVSGGGLCNGRPFSEAARAAITTLKARPGGRPEDSLIYPDHKLALQVITTRRWQDLPSLSGASLSEAILLVGEDKTHRVMSKIRPLVDTIVKNGSYQYPTSIREVSSGIRVLTQAWSQMAAFRLNGDPAAWINKLYASSSSGEKYHCYLKLVDEDTVNISKWYSDADSLENTVAVLLYSLEQLHTHPDHRLLPSNISDTSQARPFMAPLCPPTACWDRLIIFGVTPFKIFNYFWAKMLTFTQAFWRRPEFRFIPPSLEADPARLSVLLTDKDGHQTIFNEFVGRGSDGTALRCRSEKKIVKFGAPDKILHEAQIYDRLGQCKHLAVPRYWGMYPLRAEIFQPSQLAIILDDVGVPIEIRQMTRHQRSHLTHLIHRLHELGVHHHDVFGNTVVDDDGTIWLVDFGHAELVPAGSECFGCDDGDSLMVLDLED
ncbi:hypothetical protein DFH09DRAFT_1201007 [Mycena vulgaris]|nr:hypothetical protein DFH09DRAFT_1201007 [Mycena vulgaris]